jgi:methionine biosynthesis protein MetW
MTTYELSLDLTNPASTHTIQVGMVDNGTLVLDVGCHTGVLGEALVRHKATTVIGIDSDNEAVEIAKTRINNAFHANIEVPGWSDVLTQNGYKDFDTIIFGDVLEHTMYPDVILKEATSLLKQRGNIIVSIPNVAYWRVRMGLLLGNWDYTDVGILDKTHVKFYTKKTSRQLLERSGFAVLKEEVAGYSLPPRLIRMLPTLLGVQFVYKAQRT